MYKPVEIEIVEFAAEDVILVSEPGNPVETPDL